jgi:antitoxin component YwqK of YwqJK toxin-antitoxin module
MKLLLTALLAVLYFNCSAQSVLSINFIIDTSNRNIKKDTNTMVVVKLTDVGYEKSEYEYAQIKSFKFYGPLKVIKTYSDSLLSKLNGNYFEYYKNGNLKVKGFFTDDT